MNVEVPSESMPPSSVEVDLDHHDDGEEKKLIRKVDYHLVPVLGSLAFLSRLNSSNIANAKLGGLERDLNLTPEQFQWCLSIFYVGMILCQIPSQIMLRKWRPSKWLPLNVFLWGIVSVTSSFCTGFRSFFFCRLILGGLQCGFFPSFTYYISLWYQRKQQAVRFGSVWSFSALSGAFGGFIAYGISQIESTRFSKWQLMFIIEGLPIIILAAFCWFYLPDAPEDAWFLTEKERKLLTYRLAQDAGSARNHTFTWPQVFSVFTDWKTYVYGLIKFTGAVPTQCITLFLPTIIHAMGHWSPVQTQLMTAPPYLMAFFSIILFSRSSDQHLDRSSHLLGTNILSATGLLILLLVDSKYPDILYAGVIFFMCGTYSNVTMRSAWINNNFASLTRRAIVVGLMGSITAGSGFISGQIYHEKQKPRYRTGNTIALICILLQVTIVIGLRMAFKFINRRRAQMTEKEIMQQIEFYGGNDLVGDRHPKFRYTL